LPDWLLQYIATKYFFLILWHQPKVHMSYCHHFASVVWRPVSINFLHFRLLLRTTGPIKTLWARWVFTGSCEPLDFWKIPILPILTISSYLRLKIPKTYLLTNWIYRSPSFAWICLFYIHIISLSSILDRPSRLLYPAYCCAYRSHYCFTIELLCTCSTLLFWHAVILSCCACKAPHFVILQLELVLHFDCYLLLFPSTARNKLSYFNTKVSNWRLSF
jgi:hypothetical protein